MAYCYVNAMVRKRSFLKKRTKKLLRPIPTWRGTRSKSFCFFFQKEALPSPDLGGPAPAQGIMAPGAGCGGGDPPGGERGAAGQPANGSFVPRRKLAAGARGRPGQVPGGRQASGISGLFVR
jgi:hypothetical protein